MELRILVQDFLGSNWLSIFSILFGVIVAYVFYRLQKKDAASASAERKKHANAELIDVIESYIINKQEISRSVINNLTFASERYHLVSLRPDCTAITLLQDVALRLQRSRHLDIPQKTEYSVKIDSLIRDVEAEMSPLTWESMAADAQAVINEVVALVPEGNRKDVEEKLGNLASISVLVKKHGELLKLASSNSKLSSLTAGLAGVTAALSASIIGAKLSSEFDGQQFFVVVNPVMPIVWISVVAVVLIYCVYFLRGRAAKQEMSR